MAKSTGKLPEQKAEEPEQTETNNQNSGTDSQTTENEQTGSSTPPEKLTKEEEVSAEDRANQKQFIEEFDREDEEEFSREGEIVQTAGKKSPAQSEAKGDDEPELDSEGKPVVAQSPAKDEGKPEEKKTEKETPAQPEVKTAPVQEEPTAVQTPEQVQERYVKWRNDSEELLAKQHYALKPEQIDDLDTNPGEFISRMMARVYLDAVTATMTQIAQNLPTMVAQVNEQAGHSNSNEEQFYSRWPKLKEHADTVLRTGAVYRSLNPQASMEDFINEVGAQVMVAMRIPPDEAQQQINNGNNGVVKATPFKPAASTPAGGAPQTQQKNMFAQLNEEFDEELGDI